MTNQIKSEAPALYGVDPDEAITQRIADDKIIEAAREIILKRFARHDVEPLEQPAAVKRYLRLLIGGSEHEIFGMLSLDNRNRVIAYDELFRGTIDGASVYPREVVKTALANNAAAVILCHNHPSGNPEPSQQDIRITERLQQAFTAIDIRVLDHVIVGETVIAMSERGLL